MAEVGATLALIGAPGEQLLHSVAPPPLETPEPAEPIVAVVGSEPLEALTLHRLARDLSVDFGTIPGDGAGRTRHRGRRSRRSRTPSRASGYRYVASARDRRAGRAHAPRDPGR